MPIRISAPIRYSPSPKNHKKGSADEKFASVLCAATLLATPCAFANLRVNGDFTQGAPASGCAAAVTSFPGWTVTSGNVDLDSATSGCSGIAPIVGNYFVDLTGSFAPYENDVGTIMQAFTTTPGTEYSVSFNFGGNPQWQYISGYPNDGPIKAMDVLINGSVMGSYSVDTTGAALTDAQWTSETLDFMATGSTTDLSFASLNGISSPSDFGPLLDGVDVNTVPEPGTLWLMGIGLIGLGSLSACRRRGRV